MSSLLKKARAHKLSFAPDPPTSSLTPPQTSPVVPPSPASLYEPSLHIDDFGRPISQPAFASPATGASLRFGEGYGVGDDVEPAPPHEMQLLYGHAPLSTTVELSIVKVDKVVAACADEIRRRGLDTPLIMSSMALDISLEGVCSLIRSYLDDPVEWAHDLTLAHPLSIGAFMKWALARLVNERGRRGFVSSEAYESFRSAERASNYAPKACTQHLLSRLAPSNSRLLSNLLSLLSSIAAHSATNGMPPRKLASLFSPYVFGLADDRSFDETYREWQRASDALEHILLAFIRYQQADGQLPTFLERFVAGYPDSLNISYSGGPPKVAAGARTEEVTRVKRVTRFHSRNLIQQGATWDVPHSKDWSLFFAPGVSLSASTSSTASASTSSCPDRPVYTPSYRHLLNIRSSASHGLIDDDDEGELQRYKTAVEKEWAKFGEIGFSDVDEKKLEFDLTEGEREAVRRKRDTMDWSTFESAGFQHEMFAPSHLVFHHTLNQRLNTWPSSAKVLDQRLRQAEQALPAFPYDTTPREEGRVTVDATFFEAWADVLVGGGWAKDELKESSWALIQWKARPRDGTVPQQARTAGGDPRTEERWVLVEEFVPREYREALLADFKVKLKESRRVSFMRAVRRKNSFAKEHASAPSPTPRAQPVSSSSHFLAAPLSSSHARKETTLRPIDEAVFDPNHDVETKLMSLSDVHLAQPQSTGAPGSSYGTQSRYAPSTAYAPSVVSTARAADGHASTIFGGDDAQPAEHYGAPTRGPPYLGGAHNGLSRTLASEQSTPKASSSSSPYSARPLVQASPAAAAPSGGASPFAAAPVGYMKPEKEKKSGFLKRMNTKKVSEGMTRLWRGPNGANGSASGASADRSAAVAAQESAPTAAYPTYGNGGSYSPAPLAAVALPPQLQHGHSYSTPLPGVPLALAPVAGPSSSSPPLPPKDDSRSPYLSPSSGVTASPFDNGYRQSVQSTASGNPYDGIDDTDASFGGTETEADVDGAEVGEVLFRGSRSYPDGLDEAAEGRGRRPSVTSTETAQPDPEAVRTPSTSPRMAPVAQFASPPRHASLPDSPKPDADAPYDPHDPRFPSARYASGTSQLTQRVAGIVGLYEQRDREAAGTHGSPPASSDVRLTQFGFTSESASPSRP